MNVNRIAVFVDAENVTDWIKHGGIEILINELKLLGQIIIRRAYGVWSRPHLAMHQATINQQGFELIHCYHPVPGKNSADIQMTVDVMESAWQLANINCFVLVTGDSDFSPVFRRLREMGKEVIGVGQNSILSECVKTSCSRFIYTDEFVEYRQQLLSKEATIAQLTQSTHENVKEAAPQPTTDAQVSPGQRLEAFKELTKQLLQEEKQALNTSQLRNKLVMWDKSFDHKTLGFSKFSGFLKSIEGIQLIKEGTVNFASLESSKMISTVNGKPLEDQYRSLLNKHNVHFISAEKLKIIYKRATSVEPTFSKMAPLKDAVFSDIGKKNSQISKTDINKAFSIFLRLDLISTEMPGSRDEIIKVKKLKAKDFILEVDRFLISMLSGLCRTNNVELKAKELKKLTLSSISKKDIEEIINV
jgi:uncharacterized protein (TIGR00288 family)